MIGQGVLAHWPVWDVELCICSSQVGGGSLVWKEFNNASGFLLDIS